MATIGVNIRTRVQRGCDIVRLISTSEYRGKNTLDVKIYDQHRPLIVRFYDQ